MRKILKCIIYDFRFFDNTIFSSATSPFDAPCSLFTIRCSLGTIHPLDDMFGYSRTDDEIYAICMVMFICMRLLIDQRNSYSGKNLVHHLPISHLHPFLSVNLLLSLQFAYSKHYSSILYDFYKYASE